MLVRSLGFVNPNLLNKLRQDFACFAEKRIIGEGSKRCRIFVDLNDDRAAIFRATPQISRRVNNARGSDRKENVAHFGSFGRSFNGADW